MAEADAIPQEVKGRIEQIGSADIVIGLPGCDNGDAVMAFISWVMPMVPVSHGRTHWNCSKPCLPYMRFHCRTKSKG